MENQREREIERFRERKKSENYIYRERENGTVKIFEVKKAR